MNWFFIALGAPFLWALTNISDQYLVAKYSTGKRGFGGLVLFSSLVGLIAAVVIGFSNSGLTSIPTLDKLILISAGGLTIAWVVLYFYALEIEEVSNVVPWFMTIPVFGYFFGYVFLHENLSSQQLLGSLVVLAGVFLVSVDFSGSKKKIKWLAATYMVCACLIASFLGIIFKFVTIRGDFWVSSFWEYVGLGLFGVLIYILVPKYRREFNTMNQQGGGIIFALNSTSEILTVAGNLLTNYAVLLTPVTMVYLVGSFQPAIVLCLTLLATKFFPKIVKENIQTRVLLPKVAATLIIILGSIILFI